MVSRRGLVNHYSSVCRVAEGAGDAARCAPRILVRGVYDTGIEKATGRSSCQVDRPGWRRAAAWFFGLSRRCRFSGG